MGADMFIQQAVDQRRRHPMQAQGDEDAADYSFTILLLWFPAGLVLYWVVKQHAVDRTTVVQLPVRSKKALRPKGRSSSRLSRAKRQAPDIRGVLLSVLSLS